MVAVTTLNRDQPSTSEGEHCSRTRESRKKFIREALRKRSKAHINRNLGKEYVDRKGKLHSAIYIVINVDSSAIKKYPNNSV